MEARHRRRRRKGSTSDDTSDTGSDLPSHPRPPVHRLLYNFDEYLARPTIRRGRSEERSRQEISRSRSTSITSRSSQSRSPSQDSKTEHVERVQGQSSRASARILAAIEDLQRRVTQLEPSQAEVAPDRHDKRDSTDHDFDDHGRTEPSAPEENKLDEHDKQHEADKEDPSTDPGLQQDERETSPRTKNDGTTTLRQTEVKTEFFLESDPTQRESFENSSVGTFLNVRWDKPNSNPRASTGTGLTDILEILIESPTTIPVFQTIMGKDESFEGFRTEDDRLRISFIKPFRLLLQNHERIKQHAESLAMSKDRTEELSDTANNNDPGDSSNSPCLLDYLQHLLDFMDKNLSNQLKRYEEARSAKLETIRFEDLWMLFKPGDIIYAPHRKGKWPQYRPRPPPPQQRPPFFYEGMERNTPQAYKVVAAIGGRHSSYTIIHKVANRNSDLYVRLKVLCYYMDFDGNSYDCVADTFTFESFDGEVEIHTLEAYPLSYAHDPKEISVSHLARDIEPRKQGALEYLQNRGREFIQAREASHRLYEGITLGAKEEINTPVIIDFALAYTNTPQLVPPRFQLPAEGMISNESQQRGRIEVHEIVARHNQLFPREDLYWRIQGDLIDKARRELSETSEEYRALSAASTEVKEKITQRMEQDGHLILLPGAVPAFALRNRKWVLLDLDQVQPPQDEAGWDDLVLPDGHKNMVRAVVETHATGSRSTTGIAVKQSAEVDIVRGKGKGCIILLHGAPGVGKTSTAECVAAYTKRPLFPVTCGDIGYEPDVVEKNLEKHFNLAHKWGCVMLLDEADVFLAKRGRDDVKRNGLVSVFLRILEYYPGILFLTTNRVGSIDDAFRSRLHLTLYYPKLGRRQTKQIWDMNIRRVVQLNNKRELIGQPLIDIRQDQITRFVKKNWKALSWNGRQIRNAFQTAVALAEFDVRDKEPGTKPVLSKSQFKTIAKASMQFDEYLFHTHGMMDEANIASREQARHDDKIRKRDERPKLSSDTDCSSTTSTSSSDSSESSETSENDSDNSDSDKKKRKRRKDKKKRFKKDGKGKKSKSKKDKE